MDVAQVKAVILEAAGNPESGIIADYADLLSEAVVNAFAEKKKANIETQSRELRIVKPEESRQICAIIIYVIERSRHHASVVEPHRTKFIQPKQE